MKQAAWTEQEWTALLDAAAEDKVDLKRFGLTAVTGDPYRLGLTVASLGLAPGKAEALRVKVRVPDGANMRGQIKRRLADLHNINALRSVLLESLGPEELRSLDLVLRGAQDRLHAAERGQARRPWIRP